MSSTPNTVAGRVFDAANGLILFIASMAALLPFLYILLASFISPEEMELYPVLEWPSRFSLDAYRYVLSADSLTRSLLNSIFLTVSGTAINLSMTILAAYPLAQRRLRGRSVFLLLVLFTMLFNGGMIPTYFVVKGLGMVNTYWALLIPGAISAFNLIVMKNFFQQIPEELQEAAKMDGSHDMGILIRIILPLSMPAVATFGLFYAVHHWNQFFQAVIYLNDSQKWPLQVMLRQIVILGQDSFGNSSSLEEGVVLHSESVKNTVIIYATVPILLVYPFLQKHFAKGVMLGSVKG